MTSNSRAVSAHCSDSGSAQARGELKLQKAFNREDRILLCHLPENAAATQEWEEDNTRLSPRYLRVLSSFVSASLKYRSMIGVAGLGLDGQLERI